MEFSRLLSCEVCSIPEDVLKLNVLMNRIKVEFLLCTKRTYFYIRTFEVNVLNFQTAVNFKKFLKEIKAGKHDCCGPICRALSETKNICPVKESHLYQPDNNAAYTDIFRKRFKIVMELAQKRKNQAKIPEGHLEYLSKYGINYDEPPMEIANNIQERIQREKQKNQPTGNAAIAAASSNATSLRSQRTTGAVSGTTTTTMTVQEMVAAATGGQVRNLTTVASGTSSAPAVVSVANLTTVQLPAASQRIIGTSATTVATGAASSSKVKPKFRSVFLNPSEKSKPFKSCDFMYADEEERQLKKARANRRVENVHSQLGKKFTSDELQSLGLFKVSSDSDIEEWRYDAYATLENGAQTDLQEKLEKISSKTAIKKYHHQGESSRDFRNSRLLSGSANGKSGDFSKSIAKSSFVEELKKESSRSYFKRNHRSPLMEDEDDDEDSDYTDSS